jgi:hypothetical protein
MRLPSVGRVDDNTYPKSESVHPSSGMKSGGKRARFLGARKFLNKNFSSRNSQKTGLSQAQKMAWHNGCLIRFSRIEEDETGNPLRTNKYRDYEPSVDRKFVENGTQRITKNLLQPEAKGTGRCKFSTLRRPVSFSRLAFSVRRSALGVRRSLLVAYRFLRWTGAREGRHISPISPIGPIRRSHGCPSQGSATRPLRTSNPKRQTPNA